MVAEISMDRMPQVLLPKEYVSVGYGPGAQRLCHLCATIDTAAVERLQPGEDNYVVPHHSTFDALGGSAAAGCNLCQLFHQAIEDRRGTKKKYFSRGQLSIHFSATAVAEKTILRVRYHDKAVDQLPFHISSPSDELKRQLSPFPDLELCKNWLLECSGGHKQPSNEHAECPPLHNTELPSRILQVGTQSSDPIKLVETTYGEKGTYACLSHCWGSAPVSKRTLHSNLEEHLQGIPFEDLPRTFRDAVVVCRFLGLPFLWIDSLCIIQDDSNDWERECTQMSSIYQKAAVTLAASAADNANEGFLRFRKQQTCAPCLIPSKSLDHPAYIISDLGRSVAGHWFGSLELPPVTLLERAWVLQERLLSSRVIFFHRDELYFDCFAGTFREAYPSVAHQHCPQYSADTEAYNKMSFSDLVLTPFQQHPLDIWLSMIHEYSLTQLSYQSDTLPALSGLAKSFAQRCAQIGPPVGDYAAGLWMHEECLYKCLLWRATGRQKSYRVTTDESLPSWSWASCCRAVENPMVDCAVHPLTKVDIEILGHDVRPIGLNPYGSVQSGASIRMAGFLKPYTVKESIRLYGGAKRHPKGRFSVYSKDVDEDPLVDLAMFHPDSVDFGDEDCNEDVLCLSVCTDIHFHWHGIALQEISPNTYRRVGTCSVDTSLDFDNYSKEENRWRKAMEKAGTWQEFTMI